MKLGRYGVIVIVVGIVAIVGGWFAFRSNDTAPSQAASAIALPDYDKDAYNVRAPGDTRVKVEVLNATTTRGLARRATQYLRDRGFDVVATGNSQEKLDKTVVYDRSNSKKLAELVAKAMDGRVESRPDTSRYLDATVLVGRDWTPPAEPFYP